MGGSWGFSSGGQPVVPGVGERSLNPNKALLVHETSLAITVMWLAKRQPKETENALPSEEERAGIPLWFLPPGRESLGTQVPARWHGQQQWGRAVSLPWRAKPVLVICPSVQASRGQGSHVRDAACCGRDAPASRAGGGTGAPAPLRSHQPAFGRETVLTGI